MPYQPNIPTGSVPLNQDYLNLQGNFSQLNTTYGVDHVPLTDNTGTPPAGITGMHTAIHMVPVSTTASNPPNNQPINGYTAIPGAGQVFDAQINDGLNTDEALYFLSGGGRLMQLTRNTTPGLFINNYAAADGSGNVGVAYSAGVTFLPGGMLMQYGTFSQAGIGANGTIKFPFRFFTVYQIQVTINQNSGTLAFANVAPAFTTTTQFRFNSSSTSSSVVGINWMAIGI